MISWSSPRAVGWVALGYGVLSLVHFTHNAVYLSRYPSLPSSWTATGVMTSWLQLAALGTAGFLLYVRGPKRAGLAILSVFAVLGFGGLLHYALAAPAAHTAARNITIALEALGALGLLLVIHRAWRATRPIGSRR